MNSFEKWADGLLNYEEIQELIHEREFYVSQVLSPEKLKARWTEMNYTPPVPKPKQLDLF
jgi:hypothetical protein